MCLLLPSVSLALTAFRLLSERATTAPRGLPSWSEDFGMVIKRTYRA